MARIPLQFVRIQIMMGKRDKFTCFAKNQSLSTGIVVVKDGAIVAQAPDIVYLQDTNGDDKYDKRIILRKGFGTWDTHAGPSNLIYGVDNKIWGAVGYSGVDYYQSGKKKHFLNGIFCMDRDGGNFTPVGQYNNNTWGLGHSEDFELFGSTANNNHCCYTGIPLEYYHYITNDKVRNKALSTKFVQAHYKLEHISKSPLQQVDVRGGFTAASGANFYTARRFPKKYWNQMFVSEPTAHIVHFAKIVRDGAGFKEAKAGNLFASADTWCAPVYSATGPDGNFWVADWYNPVIQHNPDRRGMKGQVWNNIKGKGNAHKNALRDYSHGRIFVIRYGKDKDGIKKINPNNKYDLLKGLQSSNMFWRLTAQRLIVENNRLDLVPDLIDLIKHTSADELDINGAAIHSLWTLHGLGAHTSSEGMQVLANALGDFSASVRKAAVSVLPKTNKASRLLISSGVLEDEDSTVRRQAILTASKMPKSQALDKAVKASWQYNKQDQWLRAAHTVYEKKIPKPKPKKATF